MLEGYLFSTSKLIKTFINLEMYKYGLLVWQEWITVPKRRLSRMKEDSAKRISYLLLENKKSGSLEETPPEPDSAVEGGTGTRAGMVTTEVV